MTGRVVGLALAVGFLSTPAHVTLAEDPPASGGVAQLPLFRPGVPKPWEDPGTALGSPDDLEAISASGNLRIRIPLFAWAPPGVGPPIELAYIYNSADVALEGPLGRSVRLDAAATLRVDPDGSVTIVEPDGTPRSFRRQGDEFLGETFERCDLARVESGYELRHAGGFVRAFAPGHGRFVETVRRDRVGDAIRFLYDDADRLIEIRDSVGRAARLHVDGAHYDAIVDPEGHTFRLVYDTGFLIQVRGPSLGATGETLTLNFYWDGPTRQLVGRSTWSGAPGAIYRYDTANRVTSIRSFDGASRELAYGDSSVALTTASGQFVFSYLDGAIAERTDPQGRRVQFARDARQRAVAITEPGGTQERFEYDAADNVVAHVDAAGRRTTSTFNARHLPLVITDAVGHVTQLVYGDLDQVVSRTDATGDTTSYRRDAAGNLLEVVDFAGVTRYAAGYNEHGQLVSATDDLGQTTTIAYDERGSWTRVAVSDGRTVTRTVSLLGRTLTSTNELGETTAVSYDERGQAIATAGPFGATARVITDAEGRVVSFEDRAGPVPQTATVTWSPERYVGSNTLNGRAVRTAPPVSP